ncbi:spermatogenesis-associated protein 33 isoform X1 [Anolis carolinensis]|uniref:spermatogenesis-associated protein 33 isoform X1 n=2 Tax=Anolis carolinensis TaxID=28377 RepID=UPI0004626E5F|nr:PREDICTED: spermatogenesis-associated protein 33 isoform X2 [Anolis carolinensis]|eukprot:XP_008118858.1 PREDICTED: spermatogenesis-associated protein 33 isoform X2 [Anolis carolinensis]
MGRSHSKHDVVAPAPHMHRNAETSKPKEPKATAAQEPSHAHSTSQPSTSRAVRKPPSRGESDESTKHAHARLQNSSLDKLSKKKRPIPKIIVTGPSEELLVTSYSDMLPETKTIRDTEDYGAYTVHSRPSTVDAYRDREREHEH